MKLSMAFQCFAAEYMLENNGVGERCMVRLATIRDGYKATSAFAMAYD
jgi:hypothetical protein